MVDNWKSAQFKEKVNGHADLWDCTLENFIEKVTPVLQDHIRKNNLSSKVVKTAISFLRLKFDNKELKGEIGYEVAKAIEESLIYYVNCLGEGI
jgi:hypothetical protein